MDRLLLIFKSSLGRKFIMGATGFVLVGFIVVHMVGNLQVFAGPEVLNRYAKLLHMSEELLWVFRLVLLGSIGLHIWAAATLVRENRAARPVRYERDTRIQATYAARTMIVSGLIVVGFVVYHILHFTVQSTHPEFREFHTTLDGLPVHDVYRMVVVGFQNGWVSGFYILSVGLLCAHMSHGIASMFQSLGFMNKQTRPFLHLAALGIAAAVFAGMSSVPLAVLMGWVQWPVQV